MVPNGVALPLSFYAQFMTATGLYEKVRQLQDRLRTMEDPQTQQQALNALCQKIEDPEIPLYSQNSWQRLRLNFETERRCSVGLARTAVCQAGPSVGLLRRPVMEVLSL